MTPSELERHYIKSLSAIYDKGEATAITRFAFDELLEREKERGAFSRQELSADFIRLAEEVLVRLMEHEPVQYIFQAAWFCDMKLSVNRSVLIPRPETEELVHLIHQSSAANAKIVDIGTGSGCIALGLKKLLPDAAVTGIDISEDALTIARKNATRQRLAVNFHQMDIFNFNQHLDFMHTYEKFDIIVSNPPYIPFSEKHKLAGNVSGFEPHIALFVDDSNPVIYYEAITRFSTQFLTGKGQLFFEVHRDSAAAVRRIMQQAGFMHVNIITDLSGNERFVAGIGLK